MPAVLLVAAAAGALTMAILAILQPSLPSRIPPVLVWVASVAGAVALAVADTAPTGWEPFDLLLRAAFGALVPLAAARAGTLSTSWLLLVVVLTLLIADAPWAPVAAVAAGAFWALAAAGAATPAAAAVAAAAGIGPLAHLDWPVVTGASGGAVAVSALPVLVVGVARAGRPARGRTVLVASLAVVVLGLGAAAGLVAALSARTDIDRAVDLARDGIDQLGEDDEQARINLLDAAGAFASAEEDLTAWWARPSLLVPGVAQQARAVTTMASAGADLARTAADATEDADVDSVRPRNGRVDLDALSSLQEPLHRSLAALRSADARLDDIEGPLLVGPLAERLVTLRTEVTDALESADLAAEAVAVAPRLLGAHGPRRYFVAFQNPAELRGNGGFLGNWAELVADEGQLTLARNGRSRELTSVAPPAAPGLIEGEEEVVANWGPRVANWESINVSPDHPTVSRLISQMYPRSGGQPVDGVIAITPQALEGFLELTGPIDAPGYPESLSSENAARILLHEQYLEFPGDLDAQREDFLGDVVQVLFDQLTEGDLPGPRAIAAELGPAVQGKHLQLWSADEAEQALFERMGATGASTRNTADSFGVVTQNAGANKIDWFLHREVRHDVEWNPRTGAVQGTIAATLRNDAPPAGLPRSVIGWGGDPGDANPTADGENLMIVTIYSGHPIEDVTVDAEPIGFERLDELGHDAVRLVLSVPPQSVREVVVSVRGVVEPSDAYRVRTVRQPVANADRLESNVRLTDGWEVSGASEDATIAPGKQSLTSTNADRPLDLLVIVRPRNEALTWLDRLRGSD